MEVALILVQFILLSLVTGSCQYSHGLPVDTYEGRAFNLCSDMFPRHQYGATEGPHPFTLAITQNCIGPSQTIRVLVSTAQDELLGVFIQARVGFASQWDQSPRKAIGTFCEDEPNLVEVNCFNKTRNALGHQGLIRKSFISFTWSSPEDLAESISIGGTLLLNRRLFWRNIVAEIPFYVNCRQQPIGPSCAEEASDITFPETTNTPDVTASPLAGAAPSGNIRGVIFAAVAFLCLGVVFKLCVSSFHTFSDSGDALEYVEEGDAKENIERKRRKIRDGMGSDRECDINAAGENEAFEEEEEEANRSVNEEEANRSVNEEDVSQTSENLENESQGRLRERNRFGFLSKLKFKRKKKSQNQTSTEDHQRNENIYSDLDNNITEDSASLSDSGRQNDTVSSISRDSQTVMY